MPLTITNNVSSLNAQHNVGRSSGSLSKSLERLSSGVKINRGADGPAALVISEKQRAQISGLNAAIENTEKAVSLVQTAEGALNEINGLLVKIRSLAVDSANTGVNDTESLAANQAEVTNALETIDRIANNTQFGTKKLLNGESAISAAISGANNGGLGALSAGTNIAAGSYTVAIANNTGTGGSVTGPSGGSGTTTADGSLVISGGGLTSDVTVALSTGDTFSSAATKIQSALDNAGAQGGGVGKFVVDVTGGGSDEIRIRSNILGSAAVTVTADSAATETALGFEAAGTTGSAGAALSVTVDGQTTSVSAGSQGLNNQVSFAGSEGLSFSVNVTDGAVAFNTNTVVNVADNGLVFQIGANANQTAKVSIDKATTDVLGTGVSGLATGVANLSLVDVTSFDGAQDALKVVDAAINNVSTLRGDLGAFQAHTLESTANNLRATLENTVNAESVIRDTDFAAEVAELTKQQVLVQAGTSVLSTANQNPQLVLSLLG